MLNDYRAAAEAAMRQLLAAAKLQEGDIVVVGCSSSEVAGRKIGTAASPEIAGALLAGLLPPLQQAGLLLAAQCCEHLNRALIIEEAALRAFGFERVNALPRPKAGGSFATAAWQAMARPVAVERLATPGGLPVAAAGLDIGGTLIGMHLRPVAVPLRLETGRIGEAPVLAARTRPKFVGGSRAQYEASLL